MPRTLDVGTKVELLRQFHRRENRIPGYGEMLKLFGYRSKNAVFQLIQKLVDYGYLSKGPRGQTAFTDKLIGSVKLLGSVQAGFPSPAEEELVDTLSLDEFLIKRPDATFMLTVSGDSMIDAGIMPNDIVLVEKGVNPKSGDIVIAQVDGEWTLKFFIRDKSGIRLEPANKKYKTIVPKNSLNVGGVVTAVIRKFKR